MPIRSIPLSKKAQALEKVAKEIRRLVLEARASHLPLRSHPANTRGRPLADHPYPRQESSPAMLVWEHWKHRGVYIHDCEGCYQREYWFFRRHPELLPRRVERLGYGDNALLQHRRTTDD